MGNLAISSTLTPGQGQAETEEVSLPHRPHHREEKEEQEEERRRLKEEAAEAQRVRREQHLREKEDEKGLITCSCGHIALNEHLYNLHIECRCPHLKPLDGSGWPARHFETVPYVLHTQRAVVSKGSIAHAAFTWITLSQKMNDEEVRLVVSRVPHITAEVAAMASEDALVSSLVGIAPRLWKRWDATPPEELIPFADKCAGDSGEVLLPAIEGGELILVVKSARADLCYEVTKRVLNALDPNVESSDVTMGFGYMGKAPYGGRDLTGFVDGTRNPDHLLRAIADEVCIFPDDHPHDEKHVGGTYMFAGRFVHDLPKFERMPTQVKSEVIGRDYTTVRVHKGYDERPENPRLGEAGKDEYASMEGVPPRSHVARAFGSMMRQAYPYRRPTEEGLFFTAYARFMSEIDTALNRMCGHYAEDGSVDNLFKITKAVACNYYYVPSLVELDTLLLVDVGKAKEEADDDAGLESAKGKKEGGEEEDRDHKRVKIFIEYCTNCGYKTIFVEKKRVLESLSPHIEVIGNPSLPRLAAFEVTLEDGAVLWSKLSHPDGHNNFPEVFPTNEQLISAAVRHLPDLNINPLSPNSSTLPLHRPLQTRVGVW